MPDRNRDIFGYSSVFKRSSPTIIMQFLFLVILGLVVGLFSFIIVNAFHTGAITIYSLSQAALGGLVIVSLPALLTTATIKLIGRKVKTRHIMLVTLVFSMIYSAFILLGAAVVLATNNPVLGDVAILVGNSLIFGYWILAGKVLVGLRKSASAAAALQPFFNAVFYVSFGSSVMLLAMPVNIFFIKLIAGMLVFLVFSYIFIYIIDRPMKKALDISTVRTFTIMVTQWLYDFGSVDLFNQQKFGVRKNIDMDVVVLKSGDRYKAVFVNPNIHYGPFKNVGGSIATEVIGSMIQKKYKAVPFILHGAVNISDNPVSASQIYSMSSSIGQYIDGLKERDFTAGRGGISKGTDKQCRAIDIKMNGSSMIVLTKAPMVVEDIEREVGEDFEKVAGASKRRNVIIVDAHNSRFESASTEELQGVKKNSIYEKMYKSAIKEAVKKEKLGSMRCGFACQKIYFWLNKPKDIGEGYTSVGIFEFGRKRFCMIYFDCNNMLPGFRDEMIKHVKSQFGLEAEVLTTDTHSVNGLNLPVDNVLGRETSASAVKPVIDILINRAMSSMENVKIHSGKVRMDKFWIWGENAEAIITSASRDIIRKTWRYAPFITVGGSVVASLIVYLA